jgi:ammonia channel protein AmtB
MTPGLAFFYGGQACKRNILNIMMQSFVLNINPNGANRLLHGGSKFFMIQTDTAVLSAVYAFGFTYLMLF